MMLSSSPASDITVDSVLSRLQQPKPQTKQVSHVWVSSPLFNPENDVKDQTNDPAVALWRRFRKAYAYGMQAIAVSRLDLDPAPLVISEPPPHVTLADIRRFVPDARVMKQALGHDGALYDVVGTVSGGEAHTREVLSRLSQMLFRTDYKAYYLEEPFSLSVEASKYDINVSPTAAEVHSWLYLNDTQFTPVTDGAPRSFAELRKENKCEVYRAANKGLIAWWIPSNASISDCLVEAREFVLDSDLIVGGIKDGGLIICGRDRVAPYTVLPPLRVETIALLAAVHEKDQLEQSYQRLHAAAGKYDGQFEWAPILLSPELVDTEYGALLNVADQMLKGWSEHGEIHYENFPYPSPRTFPFKEGLMSIMDKAGQDSVTYNWNTTGAAYGLKFENGDIYVPNRTGALPVSYIPGEVAAGEEQNMLPYENRGYNYFATTGDPVLARVVQYATLYQVFHNLGVGAPREPVWSRPSLEATFERVMQDFWSKVMSVDPNTVSQKLEPAFRKVLEMRAASARIGFDANQAALLKSLDDTDLTEIDQDVRDAYQAWQALPADSKEIIQKGSSTLDFPDMTPDEFHDMTLSLEKVRLFLESAASFYKLADTYAAAAKPDGTSWIHTPAVVMSYGEDWESTGGHNVYAKLPEIVADNSVARGAVKLEDGLLRVNPDDVGRLGTDIVHEIGRGAKAIEEGAVEASEIEAKLGSALARAESRPPRPSLQALGFHSTDLHLGSKPIATGARRVETALATVESVNPALSIRNQNGTFYVSGLDGVAHPTSNLADATELAQGMAGSLGNDTSSVRIQLRDVTPEEAETVMDNARLNAQRKGFREDIVGVLEKGEGISLDPAKYDFKNIEVVKGELEQVPEGFVAKLTARIRSTVAGLSDAFLEIRITFRGAVESAAKTIRDAFEIRVKNVFEQSSPADALAILKADERKLRDLGVQKIEVRISNSKGEQLWVRVDPLSRAG
jgi:hypothetical protein